MLLQGTHGTQRSETRSGRPASRARAAPAQLFQPPIIEFHDIDIGAVIRKDAHNVVGAHEGQIPNPVAEGLTVRVDRNVPRCVSKLLKIAPPARSKAAAAHPESQSHGAADDGRFDAREE